MSDEEEQKSLKAVSEMDDKDFEELVGQVNAEYNMCWEHQQGKKNEALVRLKLYNNQKRDKKDLGDSTLFTIFQTVFASLYEDKLAVNWIGRDEGDEDVAENLNNLSEFDHREMDKEVIDYYWDWDTLFFGRGLLEMSEYRRDPDNNIFVPVPRVIDPVVFLRDHRAVSVNGDTLTGENAARFMGREVKMTMDKIKKNKNFLKNLDYSEIKLGTSIKSLVKDAQEARDEAQGRQQMKTDSESSLKVNAQYDILEWYTYWKRGQDVKKVKLWLANERSKVVGVKFIKEEQWPIIDRSLYPTAHDWDGTSIPDLIEDKQRGRAVAQNLSMDAMKADLYPMYIFDTNKIENRNDLTFNFNKFIPVDPKGQNMGEVIAPLRKASPNLGLLDFIYNSLDVSAQKATATPELQQGVPSEGERTLGELNIIAGNVGKRYSLAARIFGWSERQFWLRWYNMYKEYFGDKIDEKVMRIEGAFGPKWRKITKEDIITTKLDPDVKIESRDVARAKQVEERQSLSNYFALVLSDPTANRRWAMKKLARLNGLEKDEIDRLLPPLIDERQAEDENELLNDGKFVRVTPADNHIVHLEVHTKLNNSPQAMTHIETHKRALIMQKTNPELFPQQNPAVDIPQPGIAVGPDNQAGLINASGTQPLVPGGEEAAAPPQGIGATI